MSAWAPGPFDNEEAADFIDDLTEAPDWRMVITLMEHAAGVTGYLEEAEAELAVAAAAVVASASRPRVPPTSPVGPWPAWSALPPNSMRPGRRARTTMRG